VLCRRPTIKSSLCYVQWCARFDLNRIGISAVECLQELPKFPTWSDDQGLRRCSGQCTPLAGGSGGGAGQGQPLSCGKVCRGYGVHSASPAGCISGGDIVYNPARPGGGRSAYCCTLMLTACTNVLVPWPRGLALEARVARGEAKRRAGGAGPVPAQPAWVETRHFGPLSAPRAHTNAQVP
jgi:hypothetical protein